MSSSYPPSAPLRLGKPNGITQPARMLCRAFGVRKLQVVHVTGDGVDDAVESGMIELAEGEVSFEDEPELFVEDLPSPPPVTELPEPVVLERPVVTEVEPGWEEISLDDEPSDVDLSEPVAADPAPELTRAQRAAATRAKNAARAAGTVR